MRQGQVLVEAIVAMGILVVAVFAIFSFLSRSTSLNRQVSQEYTATYLAAEGLEIVKNLLDSSWLTCDAWNPNVSDTSSGEVDYTSWAVQPASGRFLKFDPSTGFYAYGGSGADSPFKRTLSIRTIKTDVEMRVVSKVTWKSRGGSERTVELEDHFFLWKPRPIICF